MIQRRQKSIEMEVLGAMIVAFRGTLSLWFGGDGEVGHFPSFERTNGGGSSSVSVLGNDCDGDIAMRQHESSDHRDGHLNERQQLPGENIG